MTTARLPVSPTITARPRASPTTTVRRRLVSPTTTVRPLLPPMAIMEEGMAVAATDTGDVAATATGNHECQTLNCNLIYFACMLALPFSKLKY